MTKLPKAVRKFRARLREQLEVRELPAWKPLRFEGTGEGFTVLSERVEFPDFLRELIPDLPTGEFTVAQYDRERLRRELSPENFSTVNSLFENLLVQAQMASLAVAVAEAELERAQTGSRAGKKSAAARKAKNAKRDSEIARLTSTVERDLLADRYGMKPETIRKKQLRARKS